MLRVPVSNPLLIEFTPTISHLAISLLISTLIQKSCNLRIGMKALSTLPYWQAFANVMLFTEADAIFWNVWIFGGQVHSNISTGDNMVYLNSVGPATQFAIRHKELTLILISFKEPPPLGGTKPFRLFHFSALHTITILCP